jgi:hypothetical protein
MKRVEFVLVIFRQVEACDEGLALEPCSKSEGGTFITADVASSWRPSVVLGLLSDYAFLQETPPRVRRFDAELKLP